MQEKSPPFFRPAQESNPQEKQQQGSQPRSPNQQDLNNPVANVYGKGPNLVIQSEILTPKLYYFNIFAKLFRRLSFVFAILFGLLLVVNVYVNLKLESHRKMFSLLLNEVSTLDPVKAKALDVDSKQKFYQNTLTQRYLVADKASVIFTNLGPQVNLSSAAIDPQSFSLTIEVPSPVVFAHLMASYLESDKVSSISIRSADLLVNKRVFRVILEGVFK